MIKKIVFLTLALVAFSMPADVVIPLTQDVAVAIGVQKPTDAIKFFYAKCDTLPETGKTIELATNKNTQLSIKEVKSFEVTAFEAAFAKKQNVAVLFVVPNTENSFVLQITFNATATQPDGKTKQPTWTDVRIYGKTETCPKSVDAFVKTYFSPSRLWRNVAGATAGVVGLSLVAFYPNSTFINCRHPLRKLLKQNYEYDENLDIALNAKLAFAFHGIGDADTFITIEDLPMIDSGTVDTSSMLTPRSVNYLSWINSYQILILEKSFYLKNKNNLCSNEESIRNRLLVLNDSEASDFDIRTPDINVGHAIYGQHIAVTLGFHDKRKSSTIKKTLTADHAEFMRIWNNYEKYLTQVNVS